MWFRGAILRVIQAASLSAAGNLGAPWIPFPAIKSAGDQAKEESSYR
jgi:hypothetical protein